MSAERHLARMLRLQRIHAHLVQRQAGELAAAEVAAQQASARMQRVAALLGGTAADAGQQSVAVLAGGANLRGLLAHTLEAEKRRAAEARAMRHEAATRQRMIDARAERIAEQVAGARRRAVADAVERQAGPATPARGKFLP